MKTEAEIGRDRCSYKPGNIKDQGQNPGERRELPAGSSLYDVLILDFWSPDLRENTFFVVQNIQLHGALLSSPRKPVQTPILASMQ